MREQSQNQPSRNGREAQNNVTVKSQKKKKKSGLLGRIVRRFFLLLFTLIFLVVGCLVAIMYTVFNGPSPAARDVLTMSLLEPSATKWIPGLFLGDELVEQIRADQGTELTEDVSDSSQVVINRGDALSTGGDEWANYPDGIRIESYGGKTFNAHIMIVRDPSRVYMAMATEKWSTSIPGTRINHQIEAEGALAAINAGAFLDNGTAGPEVGSVPSGIVYAQGQFRSNSYREYLQESGFAGFNQDDVLIVAKTMTVEQANELGIRDGCEFGPVLIMNGEVNDVAYNSNSGFNPRTAIGQRADGAVIFLCIDGRQPGSVGGTYKDCIDIMVEYGAVNACNMDGGSSSVMMYRDTYGRYGEAGQVQMINSYSLLQAEPRKMPDFWMVRPE